MSKYLKLFETTSQYEAYINGSDVVLPNVSVAKDAPTTVYYKPYVPPYQGFCKLTLNNGSTVELEGSGELTSAMVLQYKSTLVSAEIGELCTSIGMYVFNGCTGLTSVIIGSGVTSIGQMAFYNCTGLTSIDIPSSVTSIGSQAFSRCTGLTSVTIPNSVTSIGDYAFQSCSGLTNVTIGSGVTSIGQYAFQSCSSLTSIIVDSANTVYDSRDNCNAIIKTSTNELIAGCKNTVIPNTVTSIGVSAFYGCSGLTSITIPNSVTSIGNYVFGNCSGLTNITSNATTAPTVQYDTFYNVKTGGTLYVPTGSTGYDTWMGRLSNWTKVEQ